MHLYHFEVHVLYPLGRTVQYASCSLCALTNVIVVVIYHGRKSVIGVIENMMKVLCQTTCSVNKHHS